jgi:glyoxalase family protein
LNVLGFRQIAQEGNRHRFAAPGNALGNHVDLLIEPNLARGRQGAGSVHHIAFRAKDDAAQKGWRAEITKHLHVTEILDRTYFHSIYFREPGGVLFELATDPPGFAIDESPETLGEELRIPSWLEPQRRSIEAQLPPLTLQKNAVYEHRSA